jgi:hypothetical protein
MEAVRISIWGGRTHKAWAPKRSVTINPEILVCAMAFEKELEVYSEHLIDLLDHEGKFVVIRGEEIAGSFDTYEVALEAGYERYGPVPFLVKKIYHVEPVHYFSRDLPCRS